MNIVIVQPNHQYARMIEGMGHNPSFIETIDDARTFDFKTVDVVLFTGGADVTPALYGHTKHPTTMTSSRDDAVFVSAFERALEMNPEVKFVGICRGSQFLCVMAGGSLIQDCRGHAIVGEHPVQTKWGDKYFVTSTHHQMQFPRDIPHEMVAWDKGRAVNAQQHIEGESVDVDLAIDYEVVWYPHIKALGFQPHPEFYEGSTRDLFVRAFNEYIQPTS